MNQIPGWRSEYLNRSFQVHSSRAGVAGGGGHFANAGDMAQGCHESSAPKQVAITSDPDAKKR
jgi:hypothetical protein